jgi:hypothetical protein
MPRLGKGPLGKGYFDKIINGASRFFIDNIRKNLNSKDSGSSARVTINGSKMTELTYRKFTDEIEVLFNRYCDISDMEEKIKNPKELKTVVFNYGHTIVENDDPSLKILDNVFGEIKNL